MSSTLNVGSDGMGRWINGMVDPLIQRAFPHTTITHDDSKAPDLVIRSHFLGQERAAPYSCPYITWSGEAYRVSHLPGRPPLMEINTMDVPEIDNNFYIPHLVAELKVVERGAVAWPKRYCCAYAFSNRVEERERLFWSMRVKEPTCYGFGRCSHTRDNPFELSRAERGKNGEAFRDFAFMVAMENTVKPGYLTEKIGFAFNAGTVPIYRGDSDTVKNFFNPAAFIDVGDFASPDAAGAFAVELWRDPHKLRPYLDAPLTVNSCLSDYLAVYNEYRPWQAPFISRLREAFPDRS